ncbi:MAG: hypothetical protein WAQ27_03865 [Candidatus Microsaccharimonas sp.]
MATEKKKTNSVDLFKPVKKLTKRFHLTLFFVFIIACLSGAILLINNTLKGTDDSTYTSSINAGTIDQTTLNHLNALHTSDQAVPAPQLPAGRVNPFGE